MKNKLNFVEVNNVFFSNKVSETKNNLITFKYWKEQNKNLIYEINNNILFMHYCLQLILKYFYKM